MNKKRFQKISWGVIGSLVVLTAMQCVWVWKIYNDNEQNFKRRVQSATYKTIYKSFRHNTIPGVMGAEDAFYIDLADFVTYLEPNLLELDVLQPYYVEVVNYQLDGKVMMRSGSLVDIIDLWTSEFEIDDDGMFGLRLHINIPYREFLGEMFPLILSAIATVVLIAAALIYMARTLFRHRTIEEMRRDLTHNITHELKTPISVAMAANDALIDYPETATPERRTRYHQIIRTQLQQLTNMVQRILDTSVAEEEQMRYNPERIELSAIMEEMAEECRTRNGGGAKIGVSYTSGVAIFADLFHFKSALSTILDNALKYSPDNVVIEMRARRSGDNVTIEIEDNGPGIASRHLEHIFDKFYRIPSGDRLEVRGSGLGLWYARQVVEQQGGKITARSQIREGTTIIITLPADGTE